MVVASANKVLADNDRGGCGGEVNRILKCGVFLELHANGKRHYHFTLLADAPFGYHDIFLALLRQGVYVWFSATHSYYWTTLLYVATPSDEPGGKSEDDIDKDPWFSLGHPSVLDSLRAIPPRRSGY